MIRTIVNVVDRAARRVPVPVARVECTRCGARGLTQTVTQRRRVCPRCGARSYIRRATGLLWVLDPTHGQIDPAIQQHVYRHFQTDPLSLAQRTAIENTLQTRERGHR